MAVSFERDPVNGTDESQGSVPELAVVAPSLLLEVAVERSSDGQDEIHLHAGGQGFWVARMAARLGAKVRLCTTLGGEPGDVLVRLVERADVELDVIRAAHATPALVQDRRENEPHQVGAAPVPPLGRHEVDELFEMALAAGMSSDAVLLTGPRVPSQVKPEFYRRLAGDLRRNGSFVAADLSGQALKAACEAGLSFLKVSDEELMEAGLAERTERQDLLAGMRELCAERVERMLVSCGDDPALAMHKSQGAEVRYPQLEPREPRGSGDSIFAAIVTRLAGGEDWEPALRFGTAAGTLNVTRRGLGSAHPRDVDSLAERVHLDAP